MAGHPDPEIMRLSLSDLALRIKIMKVNLGTGIEDVLSRALDPPSPVNIQRAISALVEVRLTFEAWRGILRAASGEGIDTTRRDHADGSIA